MIALLTPLQKAQLFDYKLDTTYTNPESGTALVEGSLWMLDTASPNHVIPHTGADNPSFVMWSRTGEYSTQALGQASLLGLSHIMFDTDQFVAGAYTEGDYLGIAGGLYTVFAAVAFGVVILSPDNNNGLMRVAKLL